VEEDKFVRGFLEGKSVIEMAKESGLTREGVYIHLRKLPNWKEVSKIKRGIRKAQRLESLKDTIELLKQLKAVNRRWLVCFGLSQKGWYELFNSPRTLSRNKVRHYSTSQR